MFTYNYLEIADLKKNEQMGLIDWIRNSYVLHCKYHFRLSRGQSYLINSNKEDFSICLIILLYHTAVMWTGAAHRAIIHMFI